MLELARPSTTFATDPDLVFDGRRLEITFEFALTSGVQRERLVFEPTRALRFVAEPHCEPWHYEQAYDRVAEVADSPWLASIDEPDLSLRHLALAVDSWGCIEVLPRDASLRSAD